MRIICPACAAAYEVPDRLLGTGRSLRCRSCGHAWRVEPPATGTVVEPPATGIVVEPPATGTVVEPLATGTGSPEATAAVPPAPPPPLPEPPLPAASLRRAPQIIDPPLPRPSDLPHRGGIALRLAWGASILAVVGMGIGLWLFRAEIVEAWPPAARLYLMFGATAQG